MAEDLAQAAAIDFTESDGSECNKPSKLAQISCAIWFAGLPPASSFVLTPSFLRLPAWADKCFYCASADLPAAFAAASASAVWRARVRTVARLFLTFLVLRGFPLHFSASWLTYVVFSWHHPSLRAVSSLSKPGALLQLLSPFFCSSERLAPRSV